MLHFNGASLDIADCARLTMVLVGQGSCKMQQPVKDLSISRVVVLCILDGAVDLLQIL